VLLTRHPEFDFCVSGYFRMLFKMDDKILSQRVNPNPAKEISNDLPSYLLDLQQSA
jgi:hypothetical protein